MIDKRKTANKIYKLRRDLKLSQKEFANITKISLNTIQLLELGEFDGNIKECVINICEYTNTDKDFFEIAIARNRTKKNVDNNKFDNRIKDMKAKIDNQFNLLLKNIKNLEPVADVFYENESNTYQLKNNNKTRICAYCGKEIDITKKNVKYNNINYYVFKCNCKDFINNCNNNSEIERYKTLIFKNKLLSKFNEIFKDQNFNIEYYDLLKTYFELKVSLEMICNI